MKILFAEIVVDLHFFLLFVSDDVAGVDVELGGRRDELDELLLGEVLETLAGEGDGELKTVGDDGGGDDLVLGDFTFELGDGVLVEENGVGELFASLTLGPLLLLGVGARTGLGSLSLLLLSLLDLRGHFCVCCCRELNFFFVSIKKNSNTGSIFFIFFVESHSNFEIL